MEKVRWFALVQTLLTIGMAVFLWSLSVRLQSRPFFRWWAWAWTSFGLYLALAAALLYLPPVWTPLRISLVLTSLVFGLLQPPLLVLGAWSLRSRRMAAPRWLTVGAALVVVAAALTLALSLASSTPAEGFWVRLAPRTLALAAALLYCAAVFLGGWRKTRSWASGLTGTICFLYGIEQVVYGATGISRLVAGVDSPGTLFGLTMRIYPQLLLMDLAAVYGVCLGMVFLLIEDHQKSQQELQASVSRGREVADQNLTLQAEITERLRAEQALRESEAKFAAAFRSNPCAIAISSLEEGRVLEINDGCERQTGYSRHEVLGRTSIDLGLWVDPLERARIMAELKQQRSIANREVRWRSKSGKVLTILFSADTIQIGDQRCVLSVGEDITTLKQTETRHRAMLKALPDWMFLLSADGVFLDYHAKDRRHLLTSPYNFLGRNVSDVHPPEMARELKRCFAEAMESGEPVTLEYSLPIAGATRFYEARMVRCDTDKILSIVRDITERKRAEHEAHNLREELAHVGRVTTLGALTGSLAHEIYQPLTASMTNAAAALRLLAARPPDLVELRATLKDIIAENRRAADVLERLRTLLKKEPREYAPLDINATVDDVVKLVHSDLMAKRISLTVDLAPNLPKVLGDRIQIGQVTLNLLMNAFEAVRAKQLGARQVVLRTCAVDSQVSVSVADDGVGLTEEQLSRIFEPFYSTRDDGMGLGLAICQTIVGAHGGEISAERNTDGGMRFLFTLPAQPQA